MGLNGRTWFIWGKRGLSQVGNGSYLDGSVDKLVHGHAQPGPGHGTGWDGVVLVKVRDGPRGRP